MRTDKHLSIGLIVILTLGFVITLPTIISVGAQVDNFSAEAMWVDPQFTGGLSFCNTFTVDVYVNVSLAGMNVGATGLYAWEFKLFWENDKLNATSYTDTLPYSNWNPPNSFAGGDGINQAYNGTHGRCYRAISAIPAVTPLPTPFVGVMSVCTIDFHVIAPISPSNFTGTLALVDTITGDDTGSGFSHTDYDGSYQIVGQPPPTPTLSLAPAYTVGVLGQQFNITVEIEDLVPFHNMCGWEAKIYYNTTVLDANNALEGPFLSGFSGVNGTYFIGNINDTLGMVHMAGLFLGAHTEPFTVGTGTLAIVTFNATFEFTLPTPEGTPPFIFPLDLTDTILSDCDAQSVQHIATDAEYEAPYVSLGWDLDCYTWPYRKPAVDGQLYETPFTGEGPNFPADAFEPQELVVLYSSLVYNLQPEVGKDVLFEVHGPANPYNNITIYRVARTDWNGIATINFTIPWPDTNAEEIVIGKWYCFQKVQVKDPWEYPYYAAPNDTIFWDVGWYVELLDVIVDPDPVPKEEMVYVTVNYKVISQIPRSVVFTFTVLDDLLDPVGSAITEIVVEPGVYCNPAEGNVTVGIYIPRWAHPGPRAKVYVNAFSDMPMDCGLPYSPEASAGFNIIYVP
jgi:hypothetical protein